MRSRSQTLRIVAAGLFAAWATLASAAAQTGLAGATVATVDLSKIAVDNFGQVNSKYYRGAQPEGRDYADLAALGVKTDIDLTKDGDPNEAAMAQRAGLKFFRIPMTKHVVPTPDQIAQFMKIVSDPANQPVYVHCQGGRHRTGVMTALYRLIADHWSADQAFAEMQKYRFGAEFLHSEFASFVHDYPALLARAAAATPNQPAASKAGS
jgi:tyrosine-protein phosphatase SIW14